MRTLRPIFAALELVQIRNRPSEFAVSWLGDSPKLARGLAWNKTQGCQQ
jgi:hypothetical protein